MGDRNFSLPFEQQLSPSNSEQHHSSTPQAEEDIDPVEVADTQQPPSESSSNEDTESTHLPEGSETENTRRDLDQLWSLSHIGILPNEEFTEAGKTTLEVFRERTSPSRMSDTWCHCFGVPDTYLSQTITL